MKQSITKQQWEELGEEEKKILARFFYNDGNERVFRPLMIGNLIEFLGEDLEMRTCNAGWEVLFNFRVSKTTWRECDKSTKKELCDALWEAVKYKLNS